MSTKSLLCIQEREIFHTIIFKQFYFMKFKFAIALAISFCSTALVFSQTAPATTPTTKPNEVNARMENQNDRIQQGVKSGELTKKEAHTVRTQEKAIRTQVKAERATNGGKLTAGEKRQVNKELNGESKKIYRKKHNAAERH